MTISSQAEALSTIAIAITPAKGRVVVACRGFHAGEAIELAPAIEVPPGERSASLNSTLFPYLFVRPDEFRVAREAPGYLALGLLTLCSHSHEPNAEVRWHRDERGTWAELRALRAIRAGDEVTLFYTNIDEYGNRHEFV